MIVKNCPSFLSICYTAMKRTIFVSGIEKKSERMKKREINSFNHDDAPVLLALYTFDATIAKKIF